MPSASTSNNSTTSNNNHNKSDSTANVAHSSSPCSTSSSTSRAPPSQPNTACAACKYQRRKCKLDCILAPFFPADQQRQFLNAHRLFGVSNILKIIRDLDPLQRTQAMNTIIYQSNMRSQDPVGGCHRLIKELERQIELESAELELVMRQLTLCRAGAQATDSDVSTAAPNVDMNMIVGVNYDMDHYDAQNPIVIVPEQQHYLNYLFDEGTSSSVDPGNTNGNTSNNSHDIHHDLNHMNEESVAVEQSALFIQQQQCEDQSYEDVKPAVVDMFDLRTACTRNEEDSNRKNLERGEGKQPISYEQEHDLKGAASLLTLTNYNTSAAFESQV